MFRYCQQCGETFDDSKRHNCKAQVSAADYFLSNDSGSAAKEKQAKNRPMVEPAPKPTDARNKPKSKGVPYDKGAGERARNWQQQNQERYNDYKRQYMREYRRRKSMKE